MNPDALAAVASAYAGWSAQTVAALVLANLVSACATFAIAALMLGSRQQGRAAAALGLMIGGFMFITALDHVREAIGVWLPIPDLRAGVAAVKAACAAGVAVFTLTWMRRS